MEELGDLRIIELGDITVTLLQLVRIMVLAGAVLLVTYLLLRRLLPWYYGKESVTESTRGRSRRTIQLVAISLFVITVLRILDIDYGFDFNVQRSLTDDGAPVSLSLHISTLVKAVLAFIVAGVLDVIIEEFLVQRYRSAADQPTTADTRAARRRFRSVKPLMYTAAAIFVANDVGVARYYRVLRVDSQGQETILTVGNVLAAIFVFFLLRLLLQLMTTFFLRRYYDRSKVDTGTRFAINRLLTYFIYIIGVLLVIQAAGFNLVAIWTGAAALLVGIGIGLQQTFNDLICGIIILFERSVKVGDVVELTGHQVGTVRKIGTRTSVVETRDDIIIFVPNSKLIGENVTNWSQVNRHARFHVQVGVAYGSDTELVKSILFEIARDHPRTMSSPPPVVRLLNFGDNSLDFDVIFWSRDFLRIEDVKSDIRLSIDAAFRAKGVEIPFPQRDVWVRGGLAAGAGLEEE